jgi:hypothetical protein
MLPPIHRIDHAVVIVLSFDGAWDSERLNDEEAAIVDDDKESPWQTVDQHPWPRYVGGESRGDLTTVHQYLIEAEHPVRFHMRRLSLRQLALIRTNPSTSRITALSYALTKVEGAEVKLDRGGRSESHALTDDDMQRLRELVGDAGINELGSQALACSAVLLDSEKKP